MIIQSRSKLGHGLISKNKVSSNKILTRIGFVMLLTTNLISAQEEHRNQDDSHISIGAHLKNMHLWHGSVVHPGALITTSVEYSSSDSKFTFGLWGGASFSTIDDEHKRTGENISWTRLKRTINEAFSNPSSVRC